MPSTSEPPLDPATSPAAKPAADDAAGNGDGMNGGKSRGPLVGLILGLSIAATIVMVVFIWLRWSGVREPTTAVIFQTNPSLAGTEVVIAGDRTVTATLDGTKDSVPILVDPGEYTVSAQLRGQTLFRTPVKVTRFVGVAFDLPTIVKEAVARGVLTLDAPATAPTQSR